MRNRRAAACLILAAVAAGILLFAGASHQVENITALLSLGGGRTLLVSEAGRSTAFEVLDPSGRVERRYARPRRQSGQDVAVTGTAVDENEWVYTVEDRYDPGTGEYLGQELALYSPGRIFGRERRRIALDTSDGIRYRWVSVTGSLILIGTDEGETGITRTALDLDALCGEGQLVIKSKRFFPVRGGEGVYQVVGAGEKLAYLTRSGKVFVSSEEGSAEELYPARILEELMYPLFLAANNAETVLIGERESGNILTLSLTDGATNVLRLGNEAFSGTDYRPLDLSGMSMRDVQNFTGTAKNAETGQYDLITGTGGTFTQIRRVRQSVVWMLWRFVSVCALTALALLVCARLLRAAVRHTLEGRTLRTKLLVTTGALLLFIDAAFGFYSCSAYRATVRENLRQQAVQEGVLMTQLLHADDWMSVEFPYDYGSAPYRRLRAGLAKRSGAVRTAYYEYGTLSAGAGDTPCLYPLDILYNAPLTKLYLDAALSGEARTGTVLDARGERIACVTPVGGHSGSSVYLIETDVSQGSIDRLTRSYLWNYLLVSSLFCLAAFALTALAFTHFLEPLGRIKAGMEAFSRGTHAVRLQHSTNDEFADICKVFNKLASDIDAKIYALRTMSETCCRFVPQRLIHQLGKKNLGDLELGTHVQGNFCILSVNLFLPEDADISRTREMTGQFFSIVNGQAEEATVLSDRLNLRELKVLCPDGDTAVRIALATIARLDSYNASQSGAQLDVTFLLHMTEAYFGICGDENRYLPAVLSREMEDISRKVERFGMLANRLLVTSKAYGALDAAPYYNRFIGYLDDNWSGMGLYDFYDGTSVRMTRLLNETRATFDKAMQLYEQRRYYDAKNLFAVVLRENQNDSVARYYIFMCERHLG